MRDGEFYGNVKKPMSAEFDFFADGREREADEKDISKRDEHDFLLSSKKPMHSMKRVHRSHQLASGFGFPWEHFIP